MSAAVVLLSEFAAKRGSKPASQLDATLARVDLLDELDRARVAFCFWQGASGERYVHHVYSLLGCPPLPAANYALLTRNGAGRPGVLAVGRTMYDAPTLNLADVRHRGAKLGATEVHVHLIAGTDQERRVIEMDLHAGLFAALGQVIGA